MEPVNNNLYLNGNISYANPLSDNNTYFNNTDSIFNDTLTDKRDFTISEDKYAADDGKISFTDKIKNFGKGLISPVTAMFSSPKNFAIGALTIIGSTLLIAATGGAAAPVMVALGVAGGGIQFAKCAYKAATTDSDEEAKLA